MLDAFNRLFKLKPEAKSDQQKRLVYACAGFLAVLLLVVLCLFRQSDVFSLTVYPLLATYLAWAVYALLKQQMSVKRVEFLTFIVTGLFWFSRAGFSFFSESSGDAMLVQSIYFNYIVACIFTYLIFDTRKALLASLIIFAISWGLGLGHIFLAPFETLPGAHLIALIRFEIILLVVIGFVHAQSHFKTAFATSQAEKLLLEKFAYHDALTGLHNRRKLTSVLLEAIEVSNRYKRPLSIILLDIDHFKRINDLYGHDAGDDVLKAFAKLISPLLRTSDVWGRWGGEEFLVICPETRSHAALEVAERLRSSLEHSSLLVEVQVTSSFGVATFSEEGDARFLLKQADDALYEAKRNGRNQVVHYDNHVLLASS